MVEHPGMWDEARSLFQVGTIAGVNRTISMVLPELAGCGVSTGFGEAWVSGFDYRKVADNSTSRLGGSMVCGEGACSRSGAQRPQNDWRRSFRAVAISAVGPASHSSGSKLPRRR